MRSDTLYRRSDTLYRLDGLGRWTELLARPFSPQVPAPLPNLRLAGRCKALHPGPGNEGDTFSLEATPRSWGQNWIDRWPYRSALLCSSESWFRPQVLNWILLLRLSKAIPYPLASVSSSLKWGGYQFIPQRLMGLPRRLSGKPSTCWWWELIPTMFLAK